MIIDVSEEYEDGTSQHVQTITIDSIQEVANNDIATKEGSSKPKVQLQFELNRSGLFQLNKAEVKIEELVVVEEKTKTEKKEGEEKSEAQKEEEGE